MGKLGDSVQNVQLLQGGQDSRRGKYETLAKLERLINNYLMDLYIMNDIELKQEDLARYGLDPTIINVVYGGFSRIVVGCDTVRVEYSY